ncbi:uncharacterized protein KY384_004359 [Bacidia gigantensis]|uniref:uncharacterized protein n=1 Tax=Bacidia gigantensis TaxID=2732470 RepID=UPI001D03A744|nr:uncharacterized protein KY384_004359 [Bacidia gigantensis]KAG8531002.1 hypothetical protein KY384_004359 [Bacidia gigantensis]
MRPTASLSRRLRRLPLTTKQAANRGGYYKGTGTGPMGRHTKHGGYIIDWQKVRTYVVPAELKDCKLSPFVTKRIKEEDVKAMSEGYEKGRMGGKDFLEQWKHDNGID